MRRESQRQAEAAHDAEQQRRADAAVDASHIRYAGLDVADLRAHVRQLRADIAAALRELWLRSAERLGSLEKDWAEPLPEDGPWESAERYVFMAKHHMQSVLSARACEVRHTDAGDEIWGELGDEPESELRRLVRAARAYAADDRITRQALHEVATAG